MFKEKGVLFLYSGTPLHAGSGISLTGVDLPIQRERHTGYPLIQSSGIKGAVRAEAKARNIDHIDILFGPEDAQHAGALSFSDARILLFPVKSLSGVFAWVTCPAVLERFRRDMELIGEESIDIGAIPSPEENHAYVPPRTGLKVAEGRIILEDFDLEMEENEKVGEIGNLLAEKAFPKTPDYWAKKVKKDLAVLNDDDFSHFVEFSTEVITRIKMEEETGTVATGGLWDEEYLPSETLLYSLVLATDSRKGKEGEGEPKEASKVMEHAENQIFSQIPWIQIGGGETLGRGMVHIRFEGGSRG